MGRMYVAESSVQNSIDGIITENTSVIGLVIGQLQTSSSKDVIVHLVSTPSPSVDSSDSSDEAEHVVQQWSTINAVDEHYVANHARQVMRMLVGGFDVIGIFACAKPEELKNAQSKLRQVIFNVHKVLGKVESTVTSQNHGDRLLMQICPLTKKLTCRTFDITDHKSTGSPAELKFQKFPENFLCLQTTYSIDVTIPVPLSSLSLNLNKQILGGLQPVFSSIWNSLAVVNDQLLLDNEPICSKPTEKVRGRQHQGDEENRLPLTITLFQQTTSSDLSSSPAAVTECGAKMLVRGTIAAKAFVQAKATVVEAVQALKKDIIRSITARCELLCEDLLQGEEEQDLKVLYETPVRVFASSPHSSSIEFCDYLFPDETANDCASRFEELVGITVEPEEVISNAESVPTDADLIKPPKPVRKVRHMRQPEATHGTLSSRQMRRYFGIAATMAVASAAAWLSYWFASVDEL